MADLDTIPQEGTDDAVQHDVEAAHTTALRLGVIAALGVPGNGFDDEDHLVLRLDGATLHAQIIDGAGTAILVLGADLGEVAEEATQRVYAQLLAANLAWRSVGGGSLALDAESRHALLVLRFDGWPCAQDVLGQRLYAFIEAAERWAAVIGASDGAPPPNEAAASSADAQNVQEARMATFFSIANHA